MPYYYERIDRTNTSDAETQILELTGTKEEPKIIRELDIISASNSGIIRGKYERDTIMEIPSSIGASGDNGSRPLNLVLKEGESFQLTLQNKTAGSNAGLVGFVIYEIT